ncbi:MAG: GGDEF domain-containing protein [Chloroflexi bacterium]|nr:GGDEF domain-containing protein [Chloroflexota bacterium]
MDAQVQTDPGDAAPPPNRKKLLVRLAIMGLWAALILIQGARVAGDPTFSNIFAVAAFTLLFFAVNAQLLLLRYMGHRRWRRAMSRLHGSAYISDLEGLPNRNYLLSELRREMPRARTIEVPFVLVILSLDTIDEVRERRGDEFADRAVRGLADVLKRFTRTSDFIAHLGGHRFCVMLNECKREDSFIYLQRVPGTIAVSDGRQMFEVPVAARLHEYDMEALYATDVLRDAEESKPLHRKTQARFNALAA